MNFSPNSKALRELKAKLVGLTEMQFEAVIGLILGDVSIQSQNKGKTYRLKFEWGDITKNYAFHVYDSKSGSLLNLKLKLASTAMEMKLSLGASKPLVMKHLIL